ncbi:MAG: YidC/Oxa1 family membrane protein insertase [Candidatus Absconditabacterales bacterium]|nr:YidC/Oxa1 family membrane protein insertase [Candidatus Absconditabacterales bacterium]
MVIVVIVGGHLGRAIIILTIVLRLLLGAIAGDPMQAMQSMQSGEYQKKMLEIQEQYKNDPHRQLQEMMKVMGGKGGIFAGCKTMLYQIPVFVGIYGAISTLAGVSGSAKPWLYFDLPFDQLVYSFLHRLTQPYFDPAMIQTTFLGMDLLATGNVYLAILAALTVYANTKIMNLIKPQTQQSMILPNGMKMPDMTGMMNKMAIIMPLIIGFFTLTRRGGLALYIVTTTLVGVVQLCRTHRTVLLTRWRAWRAQQAGYGEIIEKK